MYTFCWTKNTRQGPGWSIPSQGLKLPLGVPWLVKTWSTLKHPQKTWLVLYYHVRATPRFLYPFLVMSVLYYHCWFYTHPILPWLVLDYHFYWCPVIQHIEIVAKSNPWSKHPIAPLRKVKEIQYFFASMNLHLYIIKKYTVFFIIYIYRVYTYSIYIYMYII